MILLKYSFCEIVMFITSDILKKMSFTNLVKSKLKYLKSSQAVFIYVGLMYVVLMFHQRKFIPGNSIMAGKKNGELKFILILCGGTGKGYM